VYITPMRHCCSCCCLHCCMHTLTERQFPNGCLFAGCVPCVRLRAQVMKRALGVPSAQVLPTSAPTSGRALASPAPGPEGGAAWAPSPSSEPAAAPLPKPVAGPSWALRLPAAAVSGSVMWFVLAPLDVVRALYMRAAVATAGAALPTVGDVARQLYAAHGLRGFYRGLGVTLVRAVPVACTTLPLNDALHEALGGLLV
jgi:hypothetical protein